MNEDIVAAIAAVISAIAAWIAAKCAQKQNQHAQLQISLSLYDKRYKIFRSYIKLLNAALDEPVFPDILKTFWRESGERVFLLDDELNKYIDSSEEKIKNIYKLSFKKPCDDNVPEFLDWYREKNEIDSDILKLLNDSSSAFGKYLDFKNIK